MRTDEVDRTSVQRKNGDILQGPAEARSGKAERRGCRNDAHFRGGNMPRERRADAIEEGITRGENDGRHAAVCEHRFHRLLEGAQPCMRLACDQRLHQFDMARAAEDDRCGSNQTLGFVAKAGWTVLADADKSEPALN